MEQAKHPIRQGHYTQLIQQLNNWLDTHAI